jgi:hypothetical protein
MYARIIRIFLAAALVTALVGCYSTLKTKNVSRENYRPKDEPRNVVGVKVLPVELHRVVVLPIYWNNDPKSDFVSDLDVILQLSLQRTNAFEVVPIDREVLFKLFHEYQLSSVSILPDDLLTVLAQKYAADAVMFIDLTQNRPYRPIAIGLRAKLVDAKSAKILWAVDSLFDSADPAVAVAAIDFSARGTYTAKNRESSGSILLSPRAFASFVADSIFGTLPQR